MKYAALFCLVAVWSYSLTQPLYTPTAIPVGAHLYPYPKVIAHKALASQIYPGNSLSAIQDALSSMVDGIEVDVRMSKDGVLFLYHGDTLEDYTDQKGRPEDATWAVLSQAKYKNTEEKLVSLDAFFALVGTQKAIFLDMKSPHIFDKVFAQRLVGDIVQHGLKENVFVESFNPVTLALIRLQRRDIMLMYDFTDNTVAFGEESQEQFNRIPWLLTTHWVQKQVRRIIRPDLLGARFNLDPDTQRALIEKGYPIISWTVDDPQVAKALFASGVKGLQSNKPQLIESVLKETTKRLFDAGGSQGITQSMVNVTRVEDIERAVASARKSGATISVGGRRHSMGGQTLCDGCVFLNMLPLNDVVYHPQTKTATVQSGATWQKVQETLARHGRSVKVMQSDNIFTVGGSISVNVHGWQVGSPPMADTIVGLRIVDAYGALKSLSPTKNPSLFKCVIGGYGLFGVIVDAELQTVPNTLVTFGARFTDMAHFDTLFTNVVTKNPKVELSYARLSLDPAHFLDEVGLFWYETINEAPQPHTIAPEKLVALKRALFRLSQYHSAGKTLRWQAEKTYAKQLAQGEGVLRRNDAMNTDIHILWPLYGTSKDILHEYFIPKSRAYDFVQYLKKRAHAHGINLLNVTIREVKKDTLSALSYAKQDMYGFVCLFSQGVTPQDERAMDVFTKSLIDDALDLGGTFYLPYRLHYTGEQLSRAYPEIHQWVQQKKQYDPTLLFQSQFFAHIVATVGPKE